jgi:hypothetical protein
MNLYSTELEHSSWTRDVKIYIPQNWSTLLGLVMLKISDKLLIFRMTSANAEVCFKIIL